jgi:Na+-driven multidrug efflux pump
MIELAVGVGALFAIVMLALTDVLPHAFTDDDGVIDRAHAIWPLFALMQPLNGAVFALDGILIGAGDTRFLMWSMLGCSLLVFFPIAFASLALDWGIIGVWAGLVALIVGRAVTLGTRFSSGRWAVTGARA